MGRVRKKNVEMFSSRCNLSLSQLQHSRVIVQQSPVRRTEVALCLGLTQARIHLKPPARSAATIRAAAATAPHPRCRWASRRDRIFITDLVFTPNSEELGLEFYPVRLFMWSCCFFFPIQQRNSKYPIIDGTTDTSVSLFVLQGRISQTFFKFCACFSPQL